MRFIFPLISLLYFVKASPTPNSKSTLSQNGKLFNAVAQELSLRDESASVHKPRVIMYSQHRSQVNGQPLSLLPLIDQNTGITHIIISSLHIDRKPGDIYLNDDRPQAPIYKDLVCLFHLIFLTEIKCSKLLIEDSSQFVVVNVTYTLKAPFLFPFFICITNSTECHSGQR